MNATTTNEWYTVLINQDSELHLDLSWRTYSRVGTSDLFLILSLYNDLQLLELELIHSAAFLFFFYVTNNTTIFAQNQNP